MARRGRSAASVVAVDRFRRAVLVAASIAASVALALYVMEAGHAGGRLSEGSLVERLWTSMCAGNPLEDALREEGIVKLTKENTPGWVEEELIGLHEMDQAIANEAFELLWFCRKGSALDAASFVGNELSSKGWLGEGSGSEETETFVKKEGVCRWVMVECAQAGEDAVVVLRIRHI